MLPISPTVPGFTLALGLPNGIEWVVLLVIGVLLFGRRLPEIARGLGKSIVEFKKGVKGVEDDVEASASGSRSSARLEDQSGNQRPLPSGSMSRSADPVSAPAKQADGT